MSSKTTDFRISAIIENQDIGKGNLVIVWQVLLRAGTRVLRAATTLLCMTALSSAQPEVTFTVYPIPRDYVSVNGITSGPDGALWFTNHKQHSPNNHFWRDDRISLTRRQCFLFNGTRRRTHHHWTGRSSVVYGRFRIQDWMHHNCGRHQ